MAKYIADFLRAKTDKNKYGPEEIKNNLKGCFNGKKAVIIGGGPTAKLYNEDGIDLDNTIICGFKTTYELCKSKLDIIILDSRMFSGHRAKYDYNLDKFGTIPFTIFFSDHCISRYGNTLKAYFNWISHASQYGKHGVFETIFKYDYNLVFSPKTHMEFRHEIDNDTFEGRPKIYFDGEYTLMDYHKNDIFYGDFNLLVDNFLLMIKLLNLMGIFDIKTYGIDHFNMNILENPKINGNLHYFELDRINTTIGFDCVMTYFYYNSNYDLFKKNNIIVKSNISQILGKYKRTENNDIQGIHNNLRLKIDSLFTDKDLINIGFNATQFKDNLKFLIKLFIVFKNIADDKNIIDYIKELDRVHTDKPFITIEILHKLFSLYIIGWFKKGVQNPKCY
jgi:hypothetical protein